MASFSVNTEHAAFSNAMPGEAPGIDASPNGRAPALGAADESGPAFVTSLAALANERLAKGDDSGAEEVLLRALDAAEKQFGLDHPEVALVLNELARIQLKQRRFDAAEPNLLRLLELKRAKGADHPEVATVLASIAAIHRAMGRHEAAETLWRQVLTIRERSLAPNHFSTASAIEHLAEECEARGNLSESLSLLRRAIAMRASLVGADHPTVQLVRDRIGDLQLRAAEDASPISTALVPVSAPYSRYADVPRDPRPIRTRLDSFDRRPSEGTPREFPRRSPEPPAWRSSLADGTAEENEARDRDAVPLDYSKLLNDEGDEDGESAGAVGKMIERALQTATAPLTRNGPVVIAVVGILVVAAALVLGFPMRSRAADGAAPDDDAAPKTSLKQSVSAYPVTAPGSGEARLTSAPVTIVSAAGSPSKPSVPARTSEISSRSRANESKARKETPEGPPQLTLPSLATSVLAGIDSVATKASNTIRRGSDDYTPAPPPMLVSTRRSTFGADQGNAPQRARLIGELPTPRVPPQVADVEGEVRVRFNVDSLGLPVLPSVSVVSSPNPLLSAAVIKVIPGIHFEPARMGDANAKAIGDVVQIVFQFARSK